MIMMMMKIVSFFCTHWTDFTEFLTSIIGFHILVFILFNFLFWPRALDKPGYWSVFERMQI